MKQLVAGKISGKELADWFGITQNSLSKNKNHKLAELKFFADFHTEGSKVVIDKVLIPEYSKVSNKNYQKIKEKIDPIWNETGLDTCARVSQTIYSQLAEEDQEFNLQDRTVYDYTRKGRDELYGKPGGSPGKLGKCDYVLCKIVNGNFEFLTEEEQKIKRDLLTKYFGDTDAKIEIVKNMVNNNEIREEDAFGYLKKITKHDGNGYLDFIKELEKKIGYKIVRGTYVERSAFNPTDE